MGGVVIPADNNFDFKDVVEMMDPVTIDFSWGFLWKALVLGVITYFIWPTIFVLRSWLATIVISKVIINKKIRSNLDDYYVKQNIRKKLSKMNNAQTPCLLKNELEITINNFDAELKEIERKAENVIIFIEWVALHFNLKNYNPGIDEWIKRCGENYSMGYPGSPDERYIKLQNETLNLSDFVKILDSELQEGFEKYCPP